MTEWKETIIGEYIDLISGYAFKSANFLNEYIENSLPVIKIKNVANGDTNLNDVVYHQYDASLEKFVLKKGDVLISMTGNHPHAMTQVVGDVSRYKLDTNSLLNQRVGKLVPKENTSLDFIYYLFKDKDVQNYLANQSSGSANQANISKGDILGLILRIPPLPEQTAIASILSSLDDKIDLLLRQNTTLENMAETLFRQWFVEEAKVEWEVVKMENLISIGSGKGLKKESFIENGLFPILGANGEIGRTNEFLFNEKLIYTGRVGTLGNIFRIENEKVWLSDNTLVISNSA
jgi:type I restriction enzyme S subunit